MPPSPVDTSLRGWNEKQAMSPRGLPTGSHWPFQRSSLPIAHAASSMTGSRRARGIDEERIDVERVALHIHEHRPRAAVANTVGGGDERVTHRHHIVPRANADGEERHMQGGGAAGHRAGEGCPDRLRELPLE